MHSLEVVQRQAVLLDPLEERSHVGYGEAWTMITALELYHSYWQRQEAVCEALGLPKPVYKTRRLRKVYQTISFGSQEDQEDTIMANIFTAMEWKPRIEDN